MGKRARRASRDGISRPGGVVAGRGAAQALKERQLGIAQTGLSKPMLDAMNRESKARFALGIGVVVHELERTEAIVASFGSVRWWERFTGKGRARARATAEAKVWRDRLAECASAVSENASLPDMERALRAR